jgi:tripartite-type tricarboxylate transporter receptor subunit TctC
LITVPSHPAFTRAALFAGCLLVTAAATAAERNAKTANSTQGADQYPSRPVRIITPAQPGGTTDYLARLLAARLTDVWKQQAVVDNRGSASGVNGAEIAKNAAADGYTFILLYHQHIVNAAIIPNLPYHPVNDFTPVSQMTAAGTLLVVNAAHPAKSLTEFIEWSKTTKEPINFGSAGIGSGGHLGGELYKVMTGVKAQHIPYKGTGPALIDLLAGQYHFSFSALSTAPAHVRAGKLRALAVTSPKRVAALPDIPTMAEALPGFEVLGWYGLAGPANLPQSVLNKIHAETAAYVKSVEFVKRAQADGAEAVGSDPTSFRQFMLADLKKWADVVKRSGAKFN